jgi:hypothetical protein
MRLLSQMNDGQAWGLSVHSPIRGARTDPALSRVRVRWKSVLLDPQVGIELQRASFRWRVTVLALSIARRVPSSTMATFPEAPL